MRVAYLLGSLNRGGTETLMLDVFRNIKSSDIDAIGVYRKDGVLKDEFLKTDVPSFHLSPTKNILSYLLKLRKLLKKNKITVVHAQQPMDALFAYLACTGTGIKIFLTLHGFDYGQKKGLLRYILPRTEKNIYVSRYQQKYYTAKYRLNEQKQTVVYNGIDFGKLQIAQTTDKHSLREELQLNKNTLVLGMVGNFNAVRDQMTVCRFFKLLDDKNIDFHFVFVGKRIEDDPQRYDMCFEYCRGNGLSHKVSFLGVRNDVPSILSQLDAFVYATDHDTFGIAVVEAIASGVPVFVNDWTVMQEVTDNGNWATLYKTKDENDLLEKFMLFLQNKVERARKVETIANTVINKFGIVEHIQKLKFTYQDIHTTN